VRRAGARRGASEREEGERRERPRWRRLARARLAKVNIATRRRTDIAPSSLRSAQAALPGSAPLVTLLERHLGGRRDAQASRCRPRLPRRARTTRASAHFCISLASLLAQTVGKGSQRYFRRIPKRVELQQTSGTGLLSILPSAPPALGPTPTAPKPRAEDRRRERSRRSTPSSCRPCRACSAARGRKRARSARAVETRTRKGKGARTHRVLLGLGLVLLVVRQVVLVLDELLALGREVVRVLVLRAQRRGRSSQLGRSRRRMQVRG